MLFKKGIKYLLKAHFNFFVKRREYWIIKFGGKISSLDSQLWVFFSIYGYVELRRSYNFYGCLSNKDTYDRKREI